MNFLKKFSSSFSDVVLEMMRKQAEVMRQSKHMAQQRLLEAAQEAKRMRGTDNIQKISLIKSVTTKMLCILLISIYLCLFY